MSALFSVMIFRKKFSKSVKSGVQICQELKLALIFVISDRYKIVSNIFLVWELWLKNGKKEKVRKIGKFCKNCYFLIFNDVSNINKTSIQWTPGSQIDRSNQEIIFNKK